MKAILVIEDDLNNQKVIKKALEIGYSKKLIKFKPVIQFCESLEASRKLLNKYIFDLIILDLMLKDSRNPVQTFKEVSSLTKTSIITFSCITDYSIIEEVINLGAKKFLVKRVENVIATLAYEINDVMASNEILY